MNFPTTTRERRVVGASLFALAALIVPHLSARAQVPAGPGKKVALLIGINEYDRRGFRDLDYAERDVEELAQVLGRSNYEVHLLTGSAGKQRPHKEKLDKEKPENDSANNNNNNNGGNEKPADVRRATLANIRAAIDDTLKNRTKQDLVLVALAGHGLQIEVPGPDGKPQSEAFYCPADAEASNPQMMLSIGKLLEEINRHGGGQNLVLVDACREDPTRGGMDGSTVKSLPEGVAVLFGCRAGQKTYESKNASGGHGVFFHVVLEGLRGRARSGDGEVTWSRLTEYTMERVSEEAPRLLGDDSIRQTPNLIANIPGRVPVVLPAPSRKSTIGTNLRAVYKSDAQQAGLDRTRGMLLVWVRPGSPVDRVGLKAGDIILTVDGDPIDATNIASSFDETLSQTPGTRVRIEFWRNGKESTVPVTLAVRDDVAIFRQELGLAEQGQPQAQLAAASMLARGEGVEKNPAQAVTWFRKSAEQGNQTAAFRLAMAYLLGVGVERDRDQGLQMLQKIAEAGFAPAQFELARFYRRDERDNAKALEWFRKAADNDHRDAQLDLGLHYERGRGVARDLAQAANWYRLAAEAGQPRAQGHLANLYFRGEGLPQDYTEAAKWAHCSLAREDGFGAYVLGRMHEAGKGADKDQATALGYYRRAAEKGLSEAQYRLGRFYADELTPRDYAEAAKWYRKAADRDDSLAQIELSRLYHNGLGVPQDDKQSVRWLRRAAEAGNSRAQINLGNAYERGWTGAPDRAQALELYRKAAQAGNPAGEFHLGRMYEQGLGVAKDDAEALKWIRSAADHGLADAQNALGIRYSNGRGVTKDDAQALTWYRKAAEQGEAAAQLNLGRLYELGRGTGKDQAEALKWIGKSAEQGHYRAVDKLAKMYAEGRGLPTAKDEAIRAVEALLPPVARLAADKSLSRADKLDLCDQIVKAHQKLAGDRRPGFDKLSLVLEKSIPGSSLLLTIQGKFFIDYGWDARTAKWSKDVSAEQDKTYRERLGQAQAALEKAWELDHTNGQAATQMLRVELGQGEGRERMEKWFRLAMQADPENYEACTIKLTYLEPKWYGKDDGSDLLAFGRECVSQAKGKGRLPLILGDAHLRLARYTATKEGRFNTDNYATKPRPAYFQRPGVWTDLKSAYDPYLKQLTSPAPSVARTDRSQYAKLACYCEQWAEAHRQFQALGQQVDLSVFDNKRQYETLRAQAAEKADNAQP